jgi:hypothetical protein
MPGHDELVCRIKIIMQHSQVNLEAIKQYLRTGNPLLFVHSYPRSGNTWMRHLIADILLQMSGFKTQTKLPVHPDQIIPDLYTNRIADVDPKVRIPGLILKTHEPFDRVVQFSQPTQSSQVRHIYIIRSPEDALVSYYHFHLRYEALRAQAADGPDAFCLRKLPDWVHHVESFMQAHDTGHQIHLISYEEMLADAFSVVRSVCQWFAIEAKDDMVQAAVDHMAFKNLHAKEAENPVNKDEFFFRKGVQGSGQNELKPSTLQAIRSSGIIRVK